MNLNEDDAHVMVGGLRFFKLKTGGYHVFNAYVQIGEKHAYLVSGLRVMKGRLVAPVKFNPSSRKFANTFFVSQATAELIYDSFKIQYPELELQSKEKCVKSLMYEMKRFNQWLPEHIQIDNTEIMEKSNG